jgi:hypothetical protein
MIDVVFHLFDPKRSMDLDIKFLNQIKEFTQIM